MPPRGNPVPRARNAMHWLGGLALLGFVGAGVVKPDGTEVLVAVMLSELPVVRRPLPSKITPPDCVGPT